MKPEREVEPLPAAPAAASVYLGDRFATMVRFAEHLADTGVAHGLIGPREVPRLWDRHLLNCVGVQELIDEGASVADVGSGAGLPGIVIAIARPDLDVTLIEPMLRRVNWLQMVVDDLGLSNVTIIRSRAEQCPEVEVDVVTSRAVARLDTLSQWSLPLLRSGGRMLALKGSSAGEEVNEARAAIEQLGGHQVEVLSVGDAVTDPPTAVVSVRIHERLPRPRKRSRRGSSTGRSADTPTQPKRRQRQERKRK